MSVPEGGADDAPRHPRILPLRWQVGVCNGEETHFAETVTGRFSAWEKRGKGYVIVPGALARREVGTTVEDAKAAAWTDYEARIRSALAP